MHDHIQLARFSVPSYALMVFLGISVVCIIATCVAHKRNVSLEQIVPLGIVGGIFATIGAKLYSIFLLEIDASWKMPLTRELLSNSGYTFYGGMLAGLLSMKVFCMLRKRDLECCLSDFIFEIPLLHAFWKVGCLLGGCCYGIPYDGFGSISFPEGVTAPAGIKLFPVQMLEMIILLIISAILFFYGKRKGMFPVEIYLITYGFTRFGIEFLRNYSNRYRFIFNIAISIMCVLLAYVVTIRKKRLVLGGKHSE